jgi:hypothetical protein
VFNGPETWIEDHQNGAIVDRSEVTWVEPNVSGPAEGAVRRRSGCRSRLDSGLGEARDVAVRIGEDGNVSPKLDHSVGSTTVVPPSFSALAGYSAGLSTSTYNVTAPGPPS